MDVLADSEKFPEEWLFKHRWGKGKKNQASVLPNGNKIVFLTVGGRTSAVVPAVQKKTGPVAKDVTNDDESDSDTKTPANSKRKRTNVKKEDEDEGEDIPKRAASKKRVKNEDKAPIKKEEVDPPGRTTGRRRSARSTK